MKIHISVIIPTLGRESLYPLVNNLLKQNIIYNYEIVLIPQVQLRENLLDNKKIKIFYEPLGKGFGYYRNVGVAKSKGAIIVFIDDDEMPMNNHWLNNITKLIIEKKEKVTTAGVKIKLGQGYLTDSISLLGFPGGGAVGFKTMWDVSNNYTQHLCSGNLAIDKKVLLAIGKFETKLKSGSEDVNLADKLISQNYTISYLGKATVYHVARKGFISFIKWNYLRGKSAAEYLKTKKIKGQISSRLNSSKKILLKTMRTKYFPGVIFMMFNQYLWQSAGYIIERIK